MNAATLPLLLEPAELQSTLHRDSVRIVDLCQEQLYRHQHIPGAIHLEYSRIVTHRPPILGLLPDARQLATVFSDLGITPDTHVVAYDEEGGGKAARLLWTLEAVGHTRYSLLNGGVLAWLDERFAVSQQTYTITPSDYTAEPNKQIIADKQYLLAHLHDPDVVIVDARTPGEYAGTVARAQRNGHIPGAINIEWNRVLDPKRNLRLKPETELRALYEQAGVTPDKQVVTYCHTHHRSALTYCVLKILGYPRIKGYPGSWSEWGNSPETPIES